MNVTFGAFNFNLFNGVSGDFFSGTFWLFVVILAFHALVNIAGSHLVARINGISVWWHVLGVAVILAVLIIVPDKHASADFVFTERFNNSGFPDSMFWFYVLPLGFLLTQYTITGFDSCAHISEETHGAADNAAKGVWRSIFYSAVFGWVLLLAITFAATNVDAVNKDAAGGAYVAVSILQHALDTGWFKLVLVISTVGQLFCGAACLTSSSRMCYAFSRDGAIPGWRIWSKVNSTRIPFNAVIFMAVCAGLITVPALLAGGQRRAGGLLRRGLDRGDRPLHRLRDPDLPALADGRRFEAGPWTLGRKYKWMNPFATVWVALITIIFILPTNPGGVPWNDEFDWKLVNYAPAGDRRGDPRRGHLVAASARATRSPARATRSQSSTPSSASRTSAGTRRWLQARPDGAVALQVIEPATEEVLAEVPRASAEDVDAAVARAKAAFPAWRAVAPGDRAALLHRLADALDEHARGARACSRRATPASRSATRAARWAWSSTPSATTPARPSACWATRSRWPAAWT